MLYTLLMCKGSNAYQTHFGNAVIRHQAAKRLPISVKLEGLDTTGLSSAPQPPSEISEQNSLLTFEKLVSKKGGLHLNLHSKLAKSF